MSDTLEQMVKHGTIIVLEGCDGSGKDTQTAMLLSRLASESIPFETMQFHRRATPIGKAIDHALSGGLGIPPQQLPMEFMSMLFAEDRREAAPQIQQWVDSGKLVLLNRYVESNMGFQCAKAANPAERENKLRWLEDLEYSRFGIPRSTAVIYLSLPPEVAARRRKGGDLHDTDIEYQRRVASTYAWLASREPQKWTVISGMDGARERSVDEIHQDIYTAVKRVSGF